MKKHITLILVLMVMCVTGIIGLQLFWNYQNYRSTVKTFDHDINEAMRTATDREMDQRRGLIVIRFKGWLADTALITVTCDYNNRDSNTVFHIHDRHPKYVEDKKRVFSFGLTDFKKKLKSITPAAKTYLINHFGDIILQRDLKDGTLYNYTQMLGDSLEKVYSESRTNRAALQKTI
jgi:two-component system phosphate regulon sensor histidine kinase PhoR